MTIARRAGRVDVRPRSRRHAPEIDLISCEQSPAQADDLSTLRFRQISTASGSERASINRSIDRGPLATARGTDKKPERESGIGREDNLLALLLLRSGPYL